MKLLIELLTEATLALPKGGKIVIDVGQPDDGTASWLRVMIEDAEGQQCSAGACPVPRDPIAIVEAFDAVLRTVLAGGARSMEERRAIEAHR